MPVYTYILSKSIVHELACSLMPDVCPASMCGKDVQHIQSSGRRYRGTMNMSVSDCLGIAAMVVEDFSVSRGPGVSIELNEDHARAAYSQPNPHAGHKVSTDSIPFTDFIVIVESSRYAFAASISRALHANILKISSVHHASAVIALYRACCVPQACLERPFKS